MTTLDAFGEFSRNYLAIRGYSQVTVDGYWWVIKSFTESAGNIETKDITATQVGEWIFYMEDKGNTKSTIHTNVSRFKVFIGYLNLQGWCELDHTLIKAPKQPRTLPKYTTSEAIDKMIMYAPSIRDKAIISVLFSTALRNSELRNLIRTEHNRIFNTENKPIMKKPIDNKRTISVQ